MTLRFADSFDHYTVVADKWTTQISQGTGPALNGGGRFGSGMQTVNSRIIKAGLPAAATWIVGCAWIHNLGTTPTSAQYNVLAVYDGATCQVSVRANSNGSLTVGRGLTADLGTTAVGVVQANIWAYIELKVLISDTVGTIDLRVNGVSVLSLTAQDTKQSANATADTVTFGINYNASASIIVDDVVICDTAGSTNNDFLGDVRVEALFPNGDGNSSQLVGSDGNSVNNSLLVDEAAPNGDTDYVESATVGQKDTYAFGNLTPTTGTVYGIVVNPYARKSDAGNRRIASIARLSSTEEDSADKILSTNYQYLPDVRETKPGGGAWSIADVNSAEFGVKVTV